MRPRVRWIAAVLAGAFVGALATLVAISAPARLVPIPVVVTPEAATRVEAADGIPRSIAPIAGAGCGVPDAPRDPPAPRPHSITALLISGDGITGVAASPDRHGVLAIWNHWGASLSRDDGRTFSPLFVDTRGLQGLAIDCRGRALALSELRLGIADGATTIWRDIPGLDPGTGGYRDAGAPQLVAGGGYVALLGHRGDRDILLVTGDDGETWSEIDLGRTDRDLELGIDERGTIVVAPIWTDADPTDVARLVTVEPATGAITVEEPAGAATYLVRSPDGSLIGPASLCDRDGEIYDLGACVLIAGTWRPLEGLCTDPRTDNDGVLIHHNGRVTWLARGHCSGRLEGGRIVETHDDPMEAFPIGAVDSDGRLLMLPGAGGLVRWSPRRGLRVLVTPR